MLVILTISVSLVQYMKRANQLIYAHREQEWGLFLMYVEENSREVRNIRTTFQGLECEMLEKTKEGPENGNWESIVLKKGNNHRLIYSKKGGTIIVLTEVKQAKYTIQQDVVEVKITFRDGEVKKNKFKLSTSQVR